VYLSPEVQRSARIIDLFLRHVPTQLSSLLQVAAMNHAEPVRAAAHKLKGSCASIGAVAMAAACARLQDDAERGDLTHAVELAREVNRLFVPTAGLLRQERCKGPQQDSM
jgi:HPt (histidine-containing phosphotransfer) domain-containing protein